MTEERSPATFIVPPAWAETPELLAEMQRYGEADIRVMAEIGGPCIPLDAWLAGVREAS